MNIITKNMNKMNTNIVITIVTFAGPLAKLNLANGSGVTSMLSLLKSTHAFKQEFSSELE